MKANTNTVIEALKNNPAAQSALLAILSQINPAAIGSTLAVQDQSKAAFAPKPFSIDLGTIAFQPNGETAGGNARFSATEIVRVIEGVEVRFFVSAAVKGTPKLVTDTPARRKTVAVKGKARR